MISKKFSTDTRKGKQYCPYIYVHGISSENLINLKNIIYQEGVLNFIDGYDFLGAEFSAKQFLKENFVLGSPYRVHLKILNSLDEVDTLISKISSPKEIYQLYFLEQFYQGCFEYVKHEKIIISNLNDLKDIF